MMRVQQSLGHRVVAAIPRHAPCWDRGPMTESLSIEEAQILTQEFLIGQMVPALRAVDYEKPPLDTEPFGLPLTELSRAEVLFRHVPGSSDATFLVRAF